MIEVTRLNGTRFTLNAELIETIENNPNTVITLTNGKKYVVKEERLNVKQLVMEYKTTILGALKKL